MQEIYNKTESNMKKLQVKILQNINTTKDNFQKKKNNFFPEDVMRIFNRKKRKESKINDLVKHEID